MLSFSFIHSISIQGRGRTWEEAIVLAKAFVSQMTLDEECNMTSTDRNELHGRNWEGFAADAFLSGDDALYFVHGIQDQDVVATTEHYIYNEQETHRSYQLKIGPTQGYSTNLDDKTMHEIYLWTYSFKQDLVDDRYLCCVRENYIIPNRLRENIVLAHRCKAILTWRTNVVLQSDWTIRKINRERGRFPVESDDFLCCKWSRRNIAWSNEVNENGTRLTMNVQQIRFAIGKQTLISIRTESHTIIHRPLNKSDESLVVQRQQVVHTTRTSHRRVRLR